MADDTKVESGSDSGGPIGVEDPDVLGFLDNVLASLGARYREGAEADLTRDEVFSVDASELVEWAANRANAKMPDGSVAQYRHIHKQGTTMSVEEALETPGALLFTFSKDPVGDGTQKVAHVAISLGDGRVVEATAGEHDLVRVADHGGRFNYAGAVPEFADTIVPDEEAAEYQARADRAQFDQDVDGLPDAYDMKVGDHDRDTNGLSDSAEMMRTMNLLDMLGVDSDGDGLSDTAELAMGTNPNALDSDGDLVDDHLEIMVGMDPTKADKRTYLSDRGPSLSRPDDPAEAAKWDYETASALVSDHLVDQLMRTGHEHRVSENERGRWREREAARKAAAEDAGDPEAVPPVDADADADPEATPASDADEATQTENATPADADEAPESETEDATPADEATEVDEAPGTDNATPADEADAPAPPPEDAGVTEPASDAESRFPDTDGDGIADQVEQEIRQTDPTTRDTDGDMVPDAVELQLSGLTRFGEGIDSDGDGLLDEAERLLGTDPNNPDTDNDTILDLAEVIVGMDPKVPDMVDPDDPDPTDPTDRTISGGAKVFATVATRPANPTDDDDSLPTLPEPDPSVPAEDTLPTVPEVETAPVDAAPAEPVVEEPPPIEPEPLPEPLPEPPAVEPVDVPADDA